MKAVYTTTNLGQTVCLKVPRLRGNGFVKSICGFHSMNDVYRNLMDDADEVINHKEGIADCDGYLSVPIRSFDWDADHEEKVKVVLDAIQKQFPRITEWEDVGSSFFVTQ